MAEITLAKAVVPAPRIIATAKTESSALGNVAYALFVLFCFWVGIQMLNLIVQSPGIFEHLAQGSDAARPHIEIGLAVGTVFGLIPFLLGSLVLGAIALVLKLRRHRHRYFGD